MSDALVEQFKSFVEEDPYELAWVGAECDGFRTISREEGDHLRWSQIIYVVTRFPDGRLFRWEFRQGLTEDQEDEGPWDYGSWGPTEVEEYEEVHVTKKYRKVSA